MKTPPPPFSPERPTTGQALARFQPGPAVSGSADTGYRPAFASVSDQRDGSSSIKGALERRTGQRATPGQPFGRRSADQAFFAHTYPAAFVTQAAAANQKTPPDAKTPTNPYGRSAPMGLIVKTKA